MRAWGTWFPKHAYGTGKMDAQMKRFDWRMGFAFSVLLALLLGNAILANRAVQGLVNAQERIAHTSNVRLRIRNTQIQFESSLSAIRGYFYVDDPSMLKLWYQSRRDLASDIEALDKLVVDNPDQKKHVREIRALLKEQSEMVEENLQLKAKLKGPWKNDPAKINRSKTFIEGVRNLQKTLDAREEKLAEERNKQARDDERQTRLTIFGATAMACLALVATFVLTRQVLQDRLQSERAIRQANAELERRVIERTERLQSANKELEAFSYTVSHDLRAPLRHVVGFADLLEKKSGALLDEPGRRYLNLVKDAGRRAGTLIDDLLAFSRTSRTELSVSQVSMAQKVEKIRAELVVEHPGREIRWEIGPLPDVWGDPALLRLVWRNLLENAVKYSGKQPASLIAIGASERPGEWEFFVKDNGVGFDPAHAQKLFGVFQRLHDAEAFEGTGIGLANVRRIVARHGGRTWAESAPNQGATFFFTLPKERGEVASAANANEEESRQ